MKQNIHELLRFGINGIVATVVHYSVLTINLKILAIPSAGFANIIASLFGIAASFIGSRYFVFRKYSQSIWVQAVGFSGLYFSFAIMQGIALLIWTDWLGYNYNYGFLIATLLQTAASYLANKFLIFKA